MRKSRIIYTLAPALAIALASCGGPDEQSAQPADEVSPATSANPASLAADTLGTIRYSYDPAALTRAEVDLAVPPDFEQSVFAIKFIPTPLVTNLGEQACSFGSIGDGHACLADLEIGFALALLDRPLSHYILALELAAPAQGTLEPVTVGEHEGMAFVHQSEHTTTRYTFLPAGGRTLLLADRYTDGVEVGTDALDQLRASIDF